MSYKVFSYDITEYKEFENTLNTLSKKGLNPIEMGYVSSFEKNDKHYFYTVDVLKEEKNTPKKLIRNHLITLYDRCDYRYVGSYRNMIFFRSESKRKRPKGREQILQSYLDNLYVNKFILAFLLFGVAIYSFSYSIMQQDVRHLLTDGEILFQCLIPLLCTGFAFLNVGAAFRSIQYKAKKEITKTPMKWIGYALLVMTSFSLVLGIVLDIVERGTKPLDDSILTMEKIGYKSGAAGQYSYSKSILVHAKSYTDINEDDQLLFHVVYEVKDHAQEYFDKFKVDYIDGNSKEIEKNVYIYQIETKNDSMIALVDHKIIEVTSTFDLLENGNYQKIIKFFRE
ncbi:MAG: DUF2812 domain-containing protein [Bacillota bacterium]|nr:DUF2812 domain-containing protein [Bacillota bacterium]